MPHCLARIFAKSSFILHAYFPRVLWPARKYLPNIFHYFQLFALRTPTKKNENTNNEYFWGEKEDGWPTGLSGCFVLEFINETHWVGFCFLGFALGTQLYIVFVWLFVCRLGASSNRSRRFDKCPALLATGSGFSTLFFLLAR